MLVQFMLNNVCTRIRTDDVVSVFEQNLDRPGVSYCAKITHDDNAITNAIDIYDNCRYLCSAMGCLFWLCAKSFFSCLVSEDGNVRLEVGGSIELWVVWCALQWSSALDEFQQ